MAKQKKVVLVDDIDGGEASETVSFALDGVSYEIELNEDNAARMRDDFAAWVGHAHRVGGRASTTRRSTPARRQSAGSPDTSTVREWARSNGYAVSDRGRIKGEIMEAYRAANG